MQNEYILVNLYEHENAVDCTTVFAEKKSVGFDEILRAEQSGYKSKFKLILNDFEYTGEQVVEIDGVKYFVYRTYKSSMDKIEVYIEDKLGV